MKIDIVCVGKIRENFFKEAISEYSKRLSRYVNLNIIEVADEKAPEGISEATKKNIKYSEGVRIIKAIRNGFVIALDLKGKKFSSEKFAELFGDLAVSGVSGITFVIGGSLGLSDEVLKHCNLSVSFSDMTFPHQLMRVILLEQIYRSEKIINHEPYHK